MALRTLALTAFAIAAVVHVAAAQVADGCNGGSPDATAANGFFTLDGACFGALVQPPGNTGTCDSVCTSAGLTCSSKSARTEQDCEDVLTAYSTSSGAPADMPGDLTANSGGAQCRLLQDSGGPWQLDASASTMPQNAASSCTDVSPSGGESATSVFVCECDVPEATGPTLFHISITQDSTSAVRAAGSVDAAGTVYCVVVTSGSVAPTSASIKSSGQSTYIGSGGTVIVRVTGVSGEESKTAYCVSEGTGGILGPAEPAVNNIYFGAWPCAARRPKEAPSRAV